MSDPFSDEELAALYDRLRAGDHERAPSFVSMEARAGAKGGSVASGTLALPGGRRLPLQWAMAAAAALAVVAGGSLSLHRHGGSADMSASKAAREKVANEMAAIDAALRRNLAAESSLSAWQPPTDFLLNPISNQPP